MGRTGRTVAKILIALLIWSAVVYVLTELAGVWRPDDQDDPGAYQVALAGGLVVVAAFWAVGAFLATAVIWRRDAA